jgi:metal-responsive CopG/Arc/MetJ family transcriptional regulator
MKTAISIPDPIFRSANRLAKRLHVSRSRLFSVAVDEYVRTHQTENVTDRLNAVYKDSEAQVDPALQTMQNTVLSREKW